MSNQAGVDRAQCLWVPSASIRNTSQCRTWLASGRLRTKARCLLSRDQAGSSSSPDQVVELFPAGAVAVHHPDAGVAVDPGLVGDLRPDQGRGKRRGGEPVVGGRRGLGLGGGRQRLVAAVTGGEGADQARPEQSGEQAGGRGERHRSLLGPGPDRGKLLGIDDCATIRGPLTPNSPARSPGNHLASRPRLSPGTSPPALPPSACIRRPDPPPLRTGVLAGLARGPRFRQMRVA